MMVTTDFRGYKLDTFDNKDDMETQKLSYDIACPNVTVIQSGYDMDMGFFIIWENKGY